jgi:hypothetical protein
LLFSKEGEKELGEKVFSPTESIKDLTCSIQTFSTDLYGDNTRFYSLLCEQRIKIAFVELCEVFYASVV